MADRAKFTLLHLLICNHLRPLQSCANEIQHNCYYQKIRFYIILLLYFNPICVATTPTIIPSAVISKNETTLPTSLHLFPRKLLNALLAWSAHLPYFRKLLYWYGQSHILLNCIFYTLNKLILLFSSYIFHYSLPLYSNASLTATICYLYNLRISVINFLNICTHIKKTALMCLPFCYLLLFRSFK